MVIFLGNLVYSNSGKSGVLARGGEQSEVTGNKNITISPRVDRYLSNLLLHALLEEMDSLESKNGEDDRTGVDSSEAVTEGDDDDVLNTVLLGVVVRPEADDGAESQPEGVENLVCSIKPDCWL